MEAASASTVPTSSSRWAADGSRGDGWGRVEGCSAGSAREEKVAVRAPPTPGEQQESEHQKTGHLSPGDSQATVDIAEIPSCLPKPKAPSDSSRTEKELPKDLRQQKRNAGVCEAYAQTEKFVKRCVQKQKESAEASTSSATPQVAHQSGSAPTSNRSESTEEHKLRLFGEITQASRNMRIEQDAEEAQQEQERDRHVFATHMIQIHIIHGQSRECLARRMARDDNFNLMDVCVLQIVCPSSVAGGKI